MAPNPGDELTGRSAADPRLADVPGGGRADIAAAGLVDFLAEGEDEGASRGEALDAIVVAVVDVNVVEGRARGVVVDREGGRGGEGELAGASAGGAERAERGPVCFEDIDALVADVGDVDLAGFVVDRDRGRAAALARARAGRAEDRLGAGRRRHHGKQRRRAEHHPHQSEKPHLVTPCPCPLPRGGRLRRRYHIVLI